MTESCHHLFYLYEYTIIIILSFVFFSALLVFVRHTAVLTIHRKLIYSSNNRISVFFSLLLHFNSLHMVIGGVALIAERFVYHHMKSLVELVESSTYIEIWFWFTFEYFSFKVKMNQFLYDKNSMFWKKRIRRVCACGYAYVIL